MTFLEAANLNAGDVIIYDDGRGQARGVVEFVVHGAFVAKFEDRAAPNFIAFGNREWLDHLTLVRDCTAADITFGGAGMLCLNCGGTAAHAWDIKHKTT